MTDHHTLTHLMMQRNLSRRQARWLERLSEFDLNFNYIRGEQNTVADALSRKEEVNSINSFSEVSSKLSSQFKSKVIEGYENDRFCQKLKKVLPLRRDSGIEDNLMFLAIGHLGVAKTLARLRADFFWPGLDKEITKWIRSCDTCQRVKDRTTSQQGYMQTPTMPSQPLEHIAFDFVGPLPRMQGYDMLLIVTCRLSLPHHPLLAKRHSRTHCTTVFRGVAFRLWRTEICT